MKAALLVIGAVFFQLLGAGRGLDGKDADSPGSLSAHTRYMPSSQEADEDDLPPWWFAIVAIVGMGIVCAALGLGAAYALAKWWLAGVL